MRRPALVVLGVVLLGRREVVDVLVREAGDHGAVDAGAAGGVDDRASHPAPHLGGHLAGDRDDHPLADPQRHQRHRVGDLDRERGLDLDALRARADREVVALEGHPGDVEERPAALLGAGELRQAEHRLVGDRPGGGLLAAPAHPRPAALQDRGRVHVLAGLAPGAHECLGLDPADLVGRRRPGAVKARGLVALVGVAVDVHHLLAGGHPAGAADRVLDQLGGGAVVVAVVVGELEPDHGAVVGERRPHPHRHLAPADRLVDPQHVDVGVERVQAALRVLAGASLAEVLVDAVVSEVGLDGAVIGQVGDLGLAPAELPRPEVGVGARGSPAPGGGP